LKRSIAVAIATLAVLWLGDVAAAQNAHFIGEPTCVDIGTQVRCSGKIAGLGEGPVTLRIRAVGIATVECANPAGNVAPGQATTVESTGTFVLGKPRGGQITFRRVTTEPPPAPDPAEVCPNPKWTATITDVEFTTATLVVLQGGEVVLRETVDVR
jgi:hypothetical protein